jgi:hypothetical protein
MGRELKVSDHSALCSPLVRADRLPPDLLCYANRTGCRLDVVLHDFRQGNRLLAPLMTGAIRIGGENVILWLDIL